MMKPLHGKDSHLVSTTSQYNSHHLSFSTFRHPSPVTLFPGYSANLNHQPCISQAFSLSSPPSALVSTLRTIADVELQAKQANAARV
nr:uncharacterized protein CTRU02_11406 [Colletotrichum truncatum]KAF6785781.1 hypothetical protein CTRU02_11406 [Colletotrichum truncatum]